MQAVATHKNLPATIPLPPTGHLNISNCMFNMGTMTTETKQVEVSKSPTKLPAANVPTYKKHKNPYAASRPNTTLQK
eukprot:1949847-Ditylum_brightwellii.AAC.1